MAPLDTHPLHSGASRSVRRAVSDAAAVTGAVHGLMTGTGLPAVLTVATKETRGFTDTLILCHIIFFGTVSLVL